MGQQGEASPEEPSEALSQLGRSWPVEGRLVGILVDSESDLEAVTGLSEGLLAAGVTALLVAPVGGTIGSGASAQAVQRTYLTARSVEFDAVVLAGSGAPAPDAVQGLDARSGQPGAAPVDPRVRLLVEEAYRHAKVIGAMGPGTDLVTALGLADGAPGLVTGEASDVARELLASLAAHRVWDRFPAA